MKNLHPVRACSHRCMFYNAPYGGDLSLRHRRGEPFTVFVNWMVKQARTVCFMCWLCVHPYILCLFIQHTFFQCVFVLSRLCLTLCVCNGRTHRSARAQPLTRSLGWHSCFILTLRSRCCCCCWGVSIFFTLSNLHPPSHKSRCTELFLRFHPPSTYNFYLLCCDKDNSQKSVSQPAAGWNVCEWRVALAALCHMHHEETIWATSLYLSCVNIGAWLKILDRGISGWCLHWQQHAHDKNQF